MAPCTSALLVKASPFFYISPFFVLYMEMIAAIRVAIVPARCQSLVFFGIGTKEILWDPIEHIGIEASSACKGLG